MFKKNDSLDELVAVMQASAQDRALLKEFLVDLLTPQELVEIPQRWQIVKLLARGTAQHQIAQKLGIGVATVTRGSRELQDEKGGFQLMLRKLKLNKN
jgi:TrpR family trp operon transcriptional repressor